MLIFRLWLILRLKPLLVIKKAGGESRNRQMLPNCLSELIPLHLLPRATNDHATQGPLLSNFI